MEQDKLDKACDSAKGWGLEVGFRESPASVPLMAGCLVTWGVVGWSGESKKI